MRKNRKYAAIVGVLVMVGIAFWMRELASWRPQFVTKVNFNASQLHFSRSGKDLIIRGAGKASVVNLRNSAPSPEWQTVSDFNERYGLTTFPHVWVDESKPQLYFSVARGQDVRLERVKGAHQVWLFSDNDRLNTRWSPARREVYGEAEGVIFIWDSQSGKLKKRARYGKFRQRKVVFSPDGKSLLAYERGADKNRYLWRYDVATGKTAVLLAKARDFFACEFSPDGRLICFVPADGNLQVVRATDSKPVWSAKWHGPFRWFPDGGMGMVLEDGFEFRDAQGRRVRHLPGPFDKFDDTGNNLRDWILSPDGKWIYSCHSDGTIRRWRAK